MVSYNVEFESRINILIMFCYIKKDAMHIYIYTSIQELRIKVLATYNPINTCEHKSGGRSNSKKFSVQIDFVESVIHDSGNKACYCE